MSEMTHAGKDHGDMVFVGGGNDFIITHGAAGLNDGGNAGLSSGIDAIPEREKGIRSHDGTGNHQAFVGGFDAGDTGRIHAAHLPCADTDGLAVFAIDDGVGFNKFGNFPGEQ